MSLVDMASSFDNMTKYGMYTQEAPNNITEYGMYTYETTTNMPDTTIQERHPLNTALLYTIFIVGIPSNLSIIFLVMTVKHLRNLSNLILCLMCTGDFLMIALMVPYELSPTQPTSDDMVLLNLLLAFNYFICGLSIFSLMMLSYDRHKAVTSPLQAEQTCMSNTIKVLVIVTLSTLAAAPNYFFFIKVDGKFVFSHLIYLTLASFVILYVFPLVFIAAMYTHMAITLSRHRKRVGESIKRNSKIGQQRNRTAIIVITLVILFAICWFPTFYVALHSVLSVNFHGFRNFLNGWKVIFCLINSVCDPISIYVLGSRYRHHLLQIYPFRIIRKACCKRGNEPQTESTMQSMLTSGGSYYRPTTRLHINKEDV